MVIDILKHFKQWGLSRTVGFCCSSFGWWEVMQVSTKKFSTQMDPNVKRTRRSVHKCKLDSIQDTQQGLDGPIPDKLGSHQPGAISSEVQSNDMLFSGWKKGQELPCAKSQHASVETLENRFLKVRQSLLQNTNGNVNHNFNEQTMESLHRILAGADLLKKEEATMSILGSKYDLQMGSNSEALHLPFAYLIRSNSTRSVECSSNPPKVIVKEMSKGREKSRADKSSSFKGKHLDFFEVVKEQLQQKDLENQHLVHLLLVKQQELKDMKEKSKQNERETQLITEKLKCEEQKNTEITTRFDHICEDMKEELAEAKSNNKTSMKQLKALMEKYERLKTRAVTMKDQLNLELNEKKSCQKSLKKLQQVSQELLTKQKLLEEQRDVAGRDLASCRETLQLIDAEHKKNISINQRLEEEASAIRSESANLRDHLRKAQEKNKELIQSTRSKESDNEKNVKEFQEKLNAELEKCRTERDKAHQQVETLKYESKLIHNKQRVEILQLQEQQNAHLQQSDGLRRECETLMEMANKLKRDKQVLTEKLQTIHKEKMASQMASVREGERLKEAIGLLEREREVLLAEMEDLRKDYLGISDRITQKMGHMDAADPPMTITDITSKHQRNALKLSPTDDVIQDIRRKLEEENKQQK
ncbi:coiled-coil domain-containing protein 110 [Rhinichthys klamathensis goyatoka]|uniref:coiled-coil domain-containing protein 110 n=1 Tax=Rhinichthys klamathensis goyatoka TaxID=3034132 RepID=UPI0024B4F2AA|nr:coiled-coil domain-containing protein 110 [Rhinichthys klamathensis goyatoka]